MRFSVACSAAAHAVCEGAFVSKVELHPLFLASPQLPKLDEARSVFNCRKSTRTSIPS
jgi:hypothetical protein